MTNYIDSKLYRVVLSASSDGFKTEIDLARHIRSQEAEEFKYVRKGEERISSEDTIREYVAFARDIKLLSPSLEATIDKVQIVNVTNFNNWMADCLLTFAKENGFEMADLKSTVFDLIRSKNKLPTTRNIHVQLGLGIREKKFYWCLRLLSLVRPTILSVFRGLLWIPSGTIKI